MNEPIAISGMTRRSFLSRSVKAWLSAAAAGLVGYHFYDPRIPSRLSEQANTIRLPSYAIEGISSRMAVARGSERRQTLRQAIKALGGIEAFIAPGDRVLLKVNAAFASPAILSATTHPELVSETTRLCLAAGAREVVVTDNPINDPVSCFELTGIAEAARKAGAKVVLPAEIFFKPTSLAGGTLIRNWPVLYQPFEGINKVFGISPVKDHHRSGASMSMKNWYGLLGGRRNIFHQNIHTIIQELALLMKPTLVILDGTTPMMANGPTGGSLSDLKQADILIASTDQVAADAFGATLLEKDPASLIYITKAAEAGAGSTDYQKLNPIFV